MRPEILDPTTDKIRLDQLRQDTEVKVVDFFDGQLKELKQLKKTADAKSKFSQNEPRKAWSPKVPKIL